MNLEQMAGPLGKYKGEGIGHSEEKKEVIVDDELENIVKLYGHIKFDIRDKLETRHNMTSRFVNGIVLNPIEIQNVSTLLSSKYSVDNNYGEKMGMFITALIRNSYEAGNNDFTVNLTGRESPVDDLGYKLKGKFLRPIRIKLVGDCLGLAYEAEYVHFNVEGMVRIPFSGSRQCKLVINNKEMLNSNDQMTALAVQMIYMNSQNNTIIFDSVEGLEKLCHGYPYNPKLKQYKPTNLRRALDFVKQKLW